MVFFTAPLIYPQVVQLVNYQDTFFWSGCCYSFFLLLYPAISLCNTSSESLQWFVILIATVCCFLSRLFNFTTINVLINNSTHADFRGKVNGLGQVFAAIARFVGPSMGSNLFAWSISKPRPFPLNHGFTYYLIGLLMLAIAFYIYLLPRSINKPKGKIADDYKRREQEMNDLSCKSSPKPDEESKADVDVIASTEIIDSSEKKEVANNV